MRDALSSYKLAKARNPALGLNLTRRVTVPWGTKRVYIPRRNHYHPDVLGEGNKRLEAFYDLLEPCIVERGVNGFGWHKCPYHSVYIRELAR